MPSLPYDGQSRDRNDDRRYVRDDHLHSTHRPSRMSRSSYQYDYRPREIAYRGRDRDRDPGYYSKVEARGRREGYVDARRPAPSRSRSPTPRHRGYYSPLPSGHSVEMSRRCREDEWRARERSAGDSPGVEVYHEESRPTKYATCEGHQPSRMRRAPEDSHPNESSPRESLRNVKEQDPIYLKKMVQEGVQEALKVVLPEQVKAALEAATLFNTKPAIEANVPSQASVDYLPEPVVTADTQSAVNVVQQAAANVVQQAATNGNVHPQAGSKSDMFGMYDYSTLDRTRRGKVEALWKQVGMQFDLFSGEGNPRGLEIRGMRAPKKGYINGHARMLKLYLQGQPQVHPCDACAAVKDGFPCIHDGERGRCLWCCGVDQTCSLGKLKLYSSEELAQVKHVRGYTYELASSESETGLQGLVKPALPVINRQTTSAMHAASAVYQQVPIAVAPIPNGAQPQVAGTGGDEQDKIIVIQKKIRDAFPSGLPDLQDLLVAVQQLVEVEKATAGQ